MYAKVDLKLDRDINPLPKDSSVIVRSRSALGLKYLEINKGTSGEGYPEGSIVSLKAAHPEPVEIDQVFNMFDPATRQAARGNLVAFGNALAGRGPDLNVALGELRPLVARLEPVARNLASPKTGVGRLFRALEDSAAEVAPVAEIQAQMFVSLETTFGAFAEVARPFIQESISEAPPTFDTLIRTAPRIRSFLGHSATLFADLRPGIKALSESSPTVAAAFETGADVLPGAPRLNAQLAPTARTLESVRPEPRGEGGHQALDSVLRLPQPDAAVRGARADGVQLRDAAGPQRAGPPQRQPRRHRHGPAVHRDVGGTDATPSQGSTPRTARTARRPPRPTRRRSLRTRATTSTPTHTRTRPRRASTRASVRPATSHTSRTRWSSATCPATRAPRRRGRRGEPAASKPGAREARPGESRARRADLRTPLPRPPPVDHRSGRGDPVRGRLLPGVHQARAVHQPGLRVERDVRERGRP